MKDKNLPNDYSSLSLEELTDRANMMIKDLEKEKNLESSIEKFWWEQDDVKIIQAKRKRLKRSLML